MALENLAAVSAALSQIFAPDFERQMNRLAVAAALIQAERGRGKNAAWDVEFSGATANAVEEGSDVDDTEFTTDPAQPAVLNWAHYRQSFKISETEVDAAATSIGTPEVLLDMFGERVLNAHHKLCSVINSDIYVGTGANAAGIPNLVGLFGGPLESSGVYASISRAQFAEWSGNPLANGGVPRPLTTDLMAQLEQNVFTACGEPPDLWLASAGVLRKYESYFESIRRIVSDGRGPVEYGAGASNYFYKGAPVIRDRNCSAGRLVALNTAYVRMQFLPHVNHGDALGYGEKNLEGASGKIVTATQIPARIVLLAKTGDNLKASVKTTIQLVLKRPNACGYIADIAEV
jgi:hypothetical protein